MGVIVCLNFGLVHVFGFISCFCLLVIVGVLEKFEIPLDVEDRVFYEIAVDAFNSS